MVEAIEANSSAHGIRLFGMSDPAQRIVHIVGPGQGISRPGLVTTAFPVADALSYGEVDCLSFCSRDDPTTVDLRKFDHPIVADRRHG